MGNVIFYHFDMDGRSAAYLVIKYILLHDNLDVKQTKLIEVDHAARKIENYIDEVNGDDVYIVDYAFTFDTLHVLNKILCRSKKTLWIDHHESSEKLIYNKQFLQILGDHKLDYYIKNESKSGAMLVFDYVKENLQVGDAVPEWLIAVSDWDTWSYTKKGKEYRDKILAFKYGMEEVNQHPVNGIWDELDNHVYLFQKIIDKGSIVKNHIDKSNEEYLKNYGFIAEFEGHTCLCLNLAQTSLQFGKYINDFDFVVAFAHNGNDFVYSLYTEKDIHVGNICEAYGGGGHAKAAGFHDKEMVLEYKESFLEWLKKNINK